MYNRKNDIARKVKMPESNVEYTFIFPGKKYITYVFCGVNEKGRLVLMNVETKTFTTMTPGWFSALCGKRRQLISTKPVNRAEKPKKEPSVVPNTENYETRSIRELRELSKEMEITVAAAIGYSPKRLADDLEKILSDDAPYTQAYLSRVFGDLMQAQGIYKTPVGNLAL